MIDCEKPGDCAYPGCECQDDSDPFNEEPAMTQTQQAKHTPHQCVVCGSDVSRDHWRCTNKCCPRCHADFCTAGGSTSPGHCLDIEKARAAIAEAEEAVT